MLTRVLRSGVCLPVCECFGQLAFLQVMRDGARRSDMWQ